MWVVDIECIYEPCLQPFGSNVISWVQSLQPPSSLDCGLLILFWHAPLGVCSAIRRHQPPQRTVLGQVDCLIQCEVVGSQVSLDGIEPRHAGTPWWSLQFSGGGAFRIVLASASSSIRAMCLNMKRCRDWIIAVRLGCLVILLSSSLQTNWCHLIPSSVLRHHWSRASILLASTLMTAQHSDLYRKIDRMQVLYNFSFVGIEMHDFQKWLTRLSIAAWVIPLDCGQLLTICDIVWHLPQWHMSVAAEIRSCGCAVYLT